MGLCSDAPKPPDYPTAQMNRQLDISEEAMNRYFGMSDKQQAWAENLWTHDMYPLLQETLGQQGDIQREQIANARKDRERYETAYQPLEDALIKEFQEYDSPERRELESGRAMGQVQQAWDAQRANAEQRLSSYGIDPSMQRQGALDLEARVNVAARQAAAGNQARNRVEDVGRSLRAEAINIGRGMPSQVAAAYGQSLNAANSSMGNMNATAGAGGNLMGTGQSWGQMGSNQLGQSMGGINNMYSGQLAGYNAEMANHTDPMAALGNVAGQAFGAWAGSGFAEGGGSVGAVGLEGSDLSPVPGPNDTIPITVASDEYILPKDVVLRMGTEKLDKLVETTRKKAAETGGANANTPAGAMPNPEPPIKGQTLAAEGQMFAEGGGSVGNIAPMAVPFNPNPVPINPGWGMGMAPDPFAEYNRAALMVPEAAPMDLEPSIRSGANLRENWDERKGLPGRVREWAEKRKEKKWLENAGQEQTELASAVPTLARSAAERYRASR